MNEEKKVVFKTLLFVDDKEVAESVDPILWQKVLSCITAGTNTNIPNNHLNTNFQENKTVNELDDGVSLNSKLQKFSQELGVDVELIVDTCNPSLEEPYLQFDMKSWELYKKKYLNKKRAIPDVVIVGTTLALWKKSAGLGEVTHKEVLRVLRQLNITPSNISRSYKNCVWLKFESNKVMILATKYSMAQKLVQEYCQSIA